MFSVTFTKKCPKSVPISTKVTLLMPVESVNNGVLSRSSQFQVVDAARSDNQFKSTDFSIGNLMAIGSFDTLKRSCVVSTSRLSAADQFDNFKIPQNVSES